MLRLLVSLGLIGTFWFGPAAHACTGINFHTGKRQKVRVIYKTRVSHPGRYIAEATYAPKSGRPLIIYYRRYNSLPGLYKRFVRLHECCHHRAARGGAFSDETGANCCALRRMRLSKRQAAFIKSTMIRHNINSDTFATVPGQGAVFWRRTYARCPRAARVK